MVGNSIKVESTAVRATLASDGSAKAAAAGVGASAINGQMGDALVNAGLAKIADPLSGVPVGTAVNVLASNSEKIEQATQSASAGADAAKRAQGQVEVNSAQSQKACAGVSNGPAIGCR